MKPVVLLAQAKDLHSFIKTAANMDQQKLLEINKRLLKMQIEVSEILGKLN
jgi:hypothetical protein